MPTSLARKFGIKPGHRLLVLNPPAGYAAQLTPLPAGATLQLARAPADVPGPPGGCDCVQVFVAGQADLDRWAAAAVTALKPGGLLWFAYPKISSKMGSDITRDTGWAALTALGWQGVSLIAVDATWSAMRFRPIP